MHYYFISGTSKGIGKSLADQLLSKEGNRVIGLSRTCSIHHPNYQHFNLDLSEPLSVVDHLPQLFFIPEDAKSVCLINNAGTLGEIGPMGSLSPQQLISAYQLNVISPALLTNAFLEKFSVWKIKKSITNISSGAGRMPFDGWSTYCSSKAALDMMSQVIAEESQKNKMEVKVQSIAPGIVDTMMQLEIQNSSEEKFSNHQQFLDLKTNQQLISPELAAERILKAMETSEDVILDLYQES